MTSPPLIQRKVLMRWYTSDLHLGHARICELADRPFANVEQMNRTLIDNWNEVVRPDDTVWVLGDIVMGHFAENVLLLRQLQGNKFLVPGNHDRVHPAYQDTRPHKVAEWRQMYEDNGLQILPWVWSTRIAGSAVALCHFPYEADDLGRSEYDAYRIEDDGAWLLHGHTHGRGGRKRVADRQIDVGVDCWDFYPVPESDIEDIID